MKFFVAKVDAAKVTLRGRPGRCSRRSASTTTRDDLHAAHPARPAQLGRHAGPHRPHPRQRAALRGRELQERHHPDQPRRRRGGEATSSPRSTRRSSTARSSRDPGAVVTEYSWDADELRPLPHAPARRGRLRHPRRRRAPGRRGFARAVRLARAAGSPQALLARRRPLQHLRPHAAAPPVPQGARSRTTWSSPSPSPSRAGARSGRARESWSTAPSRARTTTSRAGTRSGTRGRARSRARARCAACGRAPRGEPAAAEGRPGPRLRPPRRRRAGVARPRERARDSTSSPRPPSIGRSPGPPRLAPTGAAPVTPAPPPGESPQASSKGCGGCSASGAGGGAPLRLAAIGALILGWRRRRGGPSG